MGILLRLTAQIAIAQPEIQATVSGMLLETQMTLAKKRAESTNSY